VRVQPDQIVESVDASLKRLGTDYIDLLQVGERVAGMDAGGGAALWTEELLLGRRKEGFVCQQRAVDALSVCVEGGGVLVAPCVWRMHDSKGVGRLYVAHPDIECLHSTGRLRLLHMSCSLVPWL
jgi:hypothetical protein